MNKGELIKVIAEKAGLTKADATRALDAAIEGISTGLKKEGKVTLVCSVDSGTPETYVNIKRVPHFNKVWEIWKSVKMKKSRTAQFNIFIF